MSYIRTKLSQEDKEILREIYQELEEINIPTTYQKTGGQGHQLRTGTTKQPDARQTSFGIINFQGKIKKSKSSLKYPHIMPLFKEFMNSHYPGFKFKCVYVNKNTICKEHVDTRNTGESLLVGLGNYTGGQTILYIDDKPKKFHIKSSSLIFNGSEIPHKSEPFKGTRYSLVFFNREV
jgi:hypothetical protein